MPGQTPGQFDSAVRWMQIETPGHVISDRQTNDYNAYNAYLLTIKSVLAELLFCWELRELRSTKFGI